MEGWRSETAEGSGDGLKNRQAKKLINFRIKKYFNKLKGYSLIQRGIFY